MAAYEGHHRMARLLLNYGADVDSRDMVRYYETRAAA